MPKPILIVTFPNPNDKSRDTFESLYKNIAGGLNDEYNLLLVLSRDAKEPSFRIISEAIEIEKLKLQSNDSNG
jgi:hypothetical protein